MNFIKKVIFIWNYIFRPVPTSNLVEGQMYERFKLESAKVRDPESFLLGCGLASALINTRIYDQQCDRIRINGLVNERQRLWNQLDQKQEELDQFLHSHVPLHEHQLLVKQLQDYNQTVLKLLKVEGIDLTGPTPEANPQ